MMNNSNYNPTRPKRARGGIKARSTSGEFVKNWWAKQWLTALERLMLSARLVRGRRYARQGQVLTVEENKDGGVSARVQGSRTAPYRVNIKVAHLKDAQWEEVLDALAGQAIFAAQLLAGEMPENIEQAFTAAGVSLFPEHNGDLNTSCSCPDWANPCKHIAATYYILGDRFDEDPFLLFRLRGRTQEQVLEGLHRRRTTETDAEPAGEIEEELEEEEIPVPVDLDLFWKIGPEAAEVEVNVKSPRVPLPILQRLGDLEFSGDTSLRMSLGDAYISISRAAMAVAYQGGEMDIPGSEE